MAFLVLQEFGEQLHRHVAFLGAQEARGPVGVACVDLAEQIGFEDLAYRLADAERRDGLEVGMAFEEDDAGDQPVGVLHLLDRFLALLLGELGDAHVVEETVVEPVLVDGAKFGGKQRLFSRAMTFSFPRMHNLLG